MSPEDDLDRRLRQISFAPRESLGPEIRGRVARGDPPRRPAPAWPRMIPLAVAATLLGVAALVAWQRLTPPMVSVDQCCQDLDGGGEADDGIVVVTRAGQAVRTLRIYEDRDRSGNYSPGDALRFLRGGELAVSGPVEGSETREFCCLDYDGGGVSDDALVVVGRPPDRITMAAIYEHSATAGPARLR